MVLMRLPANPTTASHLAQALFHFNHAFDMSVGQASKVDVARTLFDGLDKLQMQWLMGQAERHLGELEAFRTMILLGLSSEAQDTLVRSTQVQRLVALDPKIMNDDIATPSSLAKDAAQVHRKLENAYRDFHANRQGAPQRVIRQVAELLDLVRSNISDGGTTLYRPYLSKRERDEQLCSCIVPVQELLLDMLLGQPSRKLIAYGSLAPGQPNHSVISDLRGEWQACAIRGTMSHKDEWLVFSWNPAGPQQNASLFTSNELPDYWPRIDQFEGADYRRRLVPAQTQGCIAIGYAYTAAR